MSDHLSEHDKFFRLIMADKDIAIDYFRICLPAVVSERLDLETLRPLPETYISEELKETLSDIVYSCRTKDAKEEMKVTLLIEHKSYVDRSAPVQIGSYVFSGYCRQWQNEKRLSIIIPVLVHHGRDKWEYCTLSGLFGALDTEWQKYPPDFDYIYHNLGKISEGEIEALNNRFLRASLLVMKHFFEKNWLASNVRMLLKWSGSGSPHQRRAFVYYLSEHTVSIKRK